MKKVGWMNREMLCFLVIAFCVILLLFDNWDSCKEKEQKTNESIPFQHSLAGKKSRHLYLMTRLPDLELKTEFHCIIVSLLDPSN